MIANLQALAEAVADVTSTVIAIRGERLALTRISAPNRDLQQGDFDVEMLGIAELDTDDRLTAHVDVRSRRHRRRLRGARRPIHGRRSGTLRAHMVGDGKDLCVFNQGELPATTPDSVFVDHRPVLTVDAVDLPSYLRAMWDVTPDIRV